MSMRVTVGSWMPCGRSTRTLATASRTSATARSIGVPMLNCTKTRDWPSIASEVMLSMLPTLATAASTFCMICVSTSCGEAPCCSTCTSTTGKLTSGFRVRGRRLKATVPRNSSTTNSTTGETGWRMAQAEIFFMGAVASLAGGGRGARRDLDGFAIAQEAAGGGHDALLAGQALRDDDAGLGRARHLDGPPLNLLRSIDHEHVAAGGVGHHGGLRQHRPLCLVNRDLGAGECAGPQRRVGLELDADVAEPRGRIDDRPEQPHVAGKGPLDAGEIDRRRLS